MYNIIPKWHFFLLNHSSYNYIYSYKNNRFQSIFVPNMTIQPWENTIQLLNGSCWGLMEPFHPQGIDKKIINSYLTGKRWTLNMSYQVVSSHPHMSTTLQIIVCIFQNEMRNKRYKISFHNFKMTYMHIIKHENVLHSKNLHLTICRQFLQPKPILLY